jgi:very-short-patch-repair endonuclease
VDRRLGVIAFSSEQAKRLQRMLYDRFDKRVLELLDLRVGVAWSFQGAQRDLVYLSTVHSPPPNGSTLRRSTNAQMLGRQLNVAMSRARRQVRVFHSVRPGAFATDDVRRPLFEHVIRSDREWDARQAPGVPALVSESERDSRFDSLSEQRLFNDLALRGFAVQEQVAAPVGGHTYRLDFVIHGPLGRVAVEYDGPHHDSVAQYLNDREREQDLIRCGWTVLRVHHGVFTLRRTNAVDNLERQLRATCTSCRSLNGTATPTRMRESKAPAPLRTTIWRRCGR